MAPAEVLNFFGEFRYLFAEFCDRVGSKSGDLASDGVGDSVIFCGCKEWLKQLLQGPQFERPVFFLYAKLEVGISFLEKAGCLFQVRSGQTRQRSAFEHVSISKALRALRQ